MSRVLYGKEKNANMKPDFKIPIKDTPSSKSLILCSNCQACCCRLEVMLITDTGVPNRFIETDDWGGQVMARLEDGWCAALDRETLSCTIYDVRPLICREFAMGEDECITERKANE